MRAWALVLFAACSETRSASPPAPVTVPARDAAVAAVADAAARPKATAYATLGEALSAIVPPQTRVVGIGELHNRTDRVQVTSTLARFREAGLPALADRLSDLIIETWIVDPKCGQPAKTATAKVEMTVRRPQETKSDIALLADAAKAKKIQPHAMTIKCDEYAAIAPAGKDIQPDVLLSLTTRELARISQQAIAHRDKQRDPRRLIAVYGGALHNDRFPAPGVEDWSYAAKVDAATQNQFVEIDLIVPELAAADPASQRQPWFPLAAAPDDRVHVFARGERSYVVILPKSAAP